MDAKNYLSYFIDTFSLTNMVDYKSCFKTLSGTLLDIMFAKKSKPFSKICTIKKELSDCHKMIATFLIAPFKRKSSKKHCL